MVQLGSAVREQLQRLGIPAEALGAQLSDVSARRLSALSERINVHFGSAPIGDNKYFGQVQDGRWNIPKPMWNPEPRQSRRQRGAYASKTYYRPHPALHATARSPFSALLDPHTRQGVVFTRGLHKNGALRQRFEQQAAMRVVPDRRADGAVSVSAMTAPGTGAANTMPGAVPQTFWDLFIQMDQAVLGEAARLGGIMTAGSDIYGWTPADGPPPPSSGISAFASDGTFFGGDSFFGGGQNLAQQEGSGVGGFDSSRGVDELTLVIKRMMDKRNQMYDVFKNVLEKHNEAARTSINNMRS